MILNKIYVVMMLIQNITVSINTNLYDSELVWEDGMLGVTPIFKSREAAAKAYPGYEVAEWGYGGVNDG